MISIYKNSYESISESTISFKDYANNVKSGYWQDNVLAYRNGKLKKELNHAVTPSGYFPENRTNEKVKNHSGIICLDFDDKDNPDILNKRDEIYLDKYLLCGHISIGGKGLALYFKIDKKKHIESFLALEKYLGNQYKIISDPSCKNVSRLRFVSYDPDLYYNENCEKWTELIEKKKSQPTNYKPIFCNNDIDYIVEQIKQTCLDLTSDYHNWVGLGFAFVNEFGERGRSYFHEVSKYNSEYNYTVADKKFDNLLKTGSKKYTISTFFWLAKINGLKIKTPQTEKIQRVATIRKKEIGKNGGAKDVETAKENTKNYLKEVENITDADNIINQVFQSNSDEQIESSEIEMVLEYVKNQKLRYNIITQRVEINGDDLTDRKENSIFLNCKELFPKAKISKDLISNIIQSDRIPEFNPFFDFIEKNKHLKPKGNIIKLLECFTLKTDNKEYAELCMLLIEKWLLSLISSIHGTYSLLILVLIGDQMTNKTNFFRFLLPDELQRYYAESKLDRDKDDELLMSQKLILVDDEFAGKSKKEAGKLKDLSSKQIITARRSYGKYNEDFQRLAVLAGTSNENDIINDTTGNRRILPIYISNIDIIEFKKINKTDLFIELFYKWKQIGDAWMLSKKEVEKLNKLTTQFNEISIEEDILKSCFRVPENNEFSEFFTATEMLSYCESYLNKQKLYHKTFGKVLRKLGYERVQKYGVGFGYKAVKIK